MKQLTLLLHDFWFGLPRAFATFGEALCGLPREEEGR